MNMYIVIVFNLKWKGIWHTHLEERSPCAPRHNKEYLLNSIHCIVRLLLYLQITGLVLELQEVLCWLHCWRCEKKNILLNCSQSSQNHKSACQLIFTLLNFAPP